MIIAIWGILYNNMHKQIYPVFWEINSGVITLSGSGKIASRFWTEIPVHFPFVDLDEFIIMPDHIHGIIIIRHSNSKPGVRL